MRLGPATCADEANQTNCQLEWKKENHAQNRPNVTPGHRTGDCRENSIDRAKWRDEVIPS